VNVYFLRHGIAERQSPGGDRERKLTEEGRSELRRVLACAKRAQLKPDLVLCSPYVRAMETAEFASEQLELEGSPFPTDALVPESSAERLWNDVREQGVDSVLVVSHEPLLSSTIAWLMGSPKVMVQFPPAGLIGIEFESPGPVPQGLLRWMITPDVC
jgi:phosphohistidine phosphatase